MRSRTVYRAAGLALAGMAAWWLAWIVSPGREIPFEAKSRPPEAAPICPWRYPDEDWPRFFPRATGFKTETRILSGQRLTLEKMLGRRPAGEENALHLHRVYNSENASQSPSNFVGTILTRRVKGEFGAIELVVGVGPDGAVRGLRLQRLREPEGISHALNSPVWLTAFEGKRWNEPWELGRDLPSVPGAAAASARAVAEGVRSLLVLLTVAEQPEAISKIEPHH